MSTEDTIQIIIREAKEILAKQSAEDFLSFVESKTSELEKSDQVLESIILWHFVSETMETFEEEDYQAYAYSKLISRYMLVDNYTKAEEVYKESMDKNLSNFHLETVRTIFAGRKQTKGNREIIKIHRMDIFGDFELIPASPTIYFENVSLIRRYAHNNLPPGTFSIVILNHRNNTKEEIEISTETLSEFEVISINEKVRMS
ncbi:MAG: hypothetical protein KGD64_02650 [Candidatus Heimdallarchaeota archaeon]|nr:hypothetical protein [Candidatus Heimdallarchaeota archaeon]